MSSNIKYHHQPHTEFLSVFEDDNLVVSSPENSSRLNSLRDEFFTKLELGMLEYIQTYDYGYNHLFNCPNRVDVYKVKG